MGRFPAARRPGPDRRGGGSSHQLCSRELASHETGQVWGRGTGICTFAGNGNQGAPSESAVFVEELTVDKRYDPFLIVACGRERFYIDVWDEPEFETQQIALPTWALSSPVCLCGARELTDRRRAICRR